MENLDQQFLSQRQGMDAGEIMIAAGASTIQYLLPPLHAGWGVRRKANHLAEYEEVAKKFAKLLGMDPWLINPMYAKCGEVNFSDGSCAECLMSNAETLLGKI